MEPTSSNRNTVIKCHICDVVIEYDSYHHDWSPIKGLSFTRTLCDECGDAFDIQTAHMTSQLITLCTRKLITWEDNLRSKKQMEKRQLKIPGI